ncbi:MAG: hypothetical protein EA409_11405 [Saprospirales bacterium]|nr:MAG: hypothetical protein EA409_11405 [Saprospirales bacterium]
MRKLLMIAVIFCAYGITEAVAQNCSGKAKAEADKKECSSKALSEEQQAMAMQVAQQSEDIKVNVCEKSGNVSFAKVSKCCTSGKETVEAVNFDPETRKFVNVSPSEVMQAEAVQTSAKSGKAETKACSSKKKEKSSTSGACSKDNK